jgi:hypothetical protein
VGVLVIDQDFVDLGTYCRRVVSSTPSRFTLKERGTNAHCMKCCSGHSVCLSTSRSAKFGTDRIRTETALSFSPIKSLYQLHYLGSYNNNNNNNSNKNSMVWVRERTIPTERPPLVGKVIANFCGQRVPRGQRDGSLRPYSRFSRQKTILFYQIDPQLYSRGWVDPVPDPLLLFGSAGNRNRASGSVAKNSDH